MGGSAVIKSDIDSPLFLAHPLVEPVCGRGHSLCTRGYFSLCACSPMPGNRWGLQCERQFPILEMSRILCSVVQAEFHPHLALFWGATLLWQETVPTSGQIDVTICAEVAPPPPPLQPSVTHHQKASLPWVPPLPPPLQPTVTHHQKASLPVSLS